MLEAIKKSIQSSSKNLEKLSQSESVLKDIEKSVAAILNSYVSGGSLYLCGNGGSAGDAQNFATELLVKLGRNRTPIRATALTVDSSILTAIGNDFSYDQVFSRQVEAHMSSKDVLIAITTSGNSKNVIEALNAAAKKKALTILLTGRDGGACKDLANIKILATGENTGEIQEAHIAIYHIMCTLIEQGLVQKGLAEYK